MMSWITATIAEAAIFHSKRIDRYTASSKKKKMSALMALSLTSRPHVGPTVVMSTLSTCVPAYVASLVATVVTGFGGSVVTVTVTSRPLIVTLGWSTAAVFSAVVTPASV